MTEDKDVTKNHEPRDTNHGPFDGLLEDTMTIIVVAVISGLAIAFLLN